MNIYKIANNVNIYFVDDSFDDFESINEIISKSGINILSDKNLGIVASINEKIVGAAWTSFNDGYFGLDVAVLPEYQRMGIGKRLTKAALNDFRSMSDMINIEGIKLDVVNPVMIPYLKEEGFAIEHEIGMHTIMIKRFA